jgi:hypothetical protein
VHDVPCAWFNTECDPRLARHKEIHAAVKEMRRRKQHARAFDVLQKLGAWLSLVEGTYAELKAADDLWASAGLSRAGDGDVETTEVLQVSDDDEEDAIDVDALNPDVLTVKVVKRDNNDDHVLHPLVKVEVPETDDSADALARERGVSMEPSRALEAARSEGASAGATAAESEEEGLMVVEEEEEEEKGLAEEEGAKDQPDAEHLTQYELEREANIARNKARMTDLGVVGLAGKASLAPSEQPKSPPLLPPPPLPPPLSPSHPHASASRRHNDSSPPPDDERRGTPRARSGGTKRTYAEMDSDGDGDSDEDYVDEGDAEEEDEEDEERETARADATGRGGAKSHGSCSKPKCSIPRGLDLAVFCENYGDGRLAHLQTEWAHPTAAMASFTRGSHERVPWKCGECGNEWEATINDRTRSDRPSGCPQYRHPRHRVKK